MGKAADSRDEQIRYLQQRLQLLQNMVDALDPESAEPNDLDPVLETLHALKVKAERFQKDWGGK